MASQNSYVEVLTPRTSECDLIWRWGLGRGNQVIMRSPGWAQHNITAILLKRRNLGTDMHWERPREDGDGDQHDVSTSQGTPRTASNPPEVGADSTSQPRKDSVC